MNIFGRFPTRQICLLGLIALGVLVSGRHSVAVTFQQRTVIETPDPYFKSALQPIETPGNPQAVSPQPIPRSYNFQPAAVPATPNFVPSPTAPAPVRVASGSPLAPAAKPNALNSRPIKGPVILAPLEPQSIWNPPNTPIANPFIQPQTNSLQQPANLPASNLPAANQPAANQPAANLNGSFSAPNPSQNKSGSGTTTGAFEPAGTIQSVSPTAASPFVAPKSIIREQPVGLQPNASPPAQPRPTESFPAQPIQNTIQNSFKQNLKSPLGSIQSPQTKENDFVPKVSPAKVAQAATEVEPKKVNRASTISSTVGAADFGGSPSQQLIKQVGFIEPVTTPTTKQDDAVPFEAGKVIAIVGGEPIFVGDMIFEINQLIEKFIPTAPEDVKQRERQKMIPQILPKFVESRLLYHGMLKQLPEGVDVQEVITNASSEFDSKAMPGIMKAAGVDSVPQFDAYLRSLGSSLRNMRETWARDQMTRFFLGQAINVNTEVTHQEMLNVYRENLDSYAQVAKARWEQIMIRFDKSDSRAAAKAEIEKLNSQIVHGANLAALAKKSSHGFLASEGGQQDWTSKGSLVLKELDAAIFTLPTGTLSGVIETRDGFHIVRVLERTEAGHTSFVEAQVDIKKKIIGEKRKVAYDKHLAKLRDQIPVEYFLNEEAIARLEAKNQRR